MKLARLTVCALAALAAMPAAAHAENTSVKVAGVRAQPGALPSTGAPLYVTVRVDRPNSAAVKFRVTVPASLDLASAPAAPVTCAAPVGAGAVNVIDCVLTADTGPGATAEMVFIPRQPGGISVSAQRVGAPDDNIADDSSTAAAMILGKPTLGPNVEVDEPDFSDLELDEEDAEQAQEAIEKAAEAAAGGPTGKLHLVTERARVSAKRTITLKVLCAGGPCKATTVRLHAKNRLSKTVKVAAIADGARRAVKIRLTAAQVRKLGRKSVKVKVTGAGAKRTITVRR